MSIEKPKFSYTSNAVIGEWLLARLRMLHKPLFSS